MYLSFTGKVSPINVFGFCVLLLQGLGIYMAFDLAYLMTGFSKTLVLILCDIWA